LRELLDLNGDRQAMNAAVDVFNANQRLLQHRGRFQFLDRVWRWYGQAMALAVRRQLDPDRRSASLRVLLRELRARPTAYRVETLRQLSPHASDEAIASLGRAIKNANGSIDVGQVDQDLRALDEVGTQVAEFVNRHVAHTNFNPSRDVTAPRYLEINVAFDNLETIAGKYFGLFFSGSLRFHVSQSSDWIDVFEFPWRMRRAPDALTSREYLINVDTIIDGQTARDWYDADLTSRKVIAAQTREAISVARKALALEPNESISETIVPEIVRVERLA
jgi:hypothetical protein